jgi:flagellar biosynthesis component FlhA
MPACESHVDHQIFDGLCLNNRMPGGPEEAGFLASLGISPGMGLFLLLLLIGHVVLISWLCQKTRLKAAKWKLKKRRLQFPKSNYTS